MTAQVIQGFSRHLKAQGKQRATIESYTRDVSAFLEYLHQLRMPLEAVEPSTVIFYQQYLHTECKFHTNSIRRAVISIRQFFRYRSELEGLSTTAFDEVVIPARQETEIPTSFQEKHLHRFIQKLQVDLHSIKALRDGALLCLLAYEGLKVNEIILLKWEDYLPDRHYTTLRVEGPRSRIIQVLQRTSDALRLYQTGCQLFYKKESRKKHRLFFSFQGKDLTPYTGISRHGVKYMLYERGEELGVTPLHTERLRQHAIENLLRIGKTPEEIMKHLGLLRLGKIARLVR